jgi:alkanesulfonate monooxygenase SsuD/methylene tetrahydromethanopterin reductase-like flavin-dependent oxidoreductase (luciferase family)
MKFLAITLIAHHDARSHAERLREVVDNAVLAEELGFDGFGVGERHERPFLSSSPPVLLSHIAARTSRIRLFTAVTTLSLLDPVRAFEDYATLDNLSGGSPQQIIDKVLRYHKRFGHEVMHLHADADGLTPEQHRGALELFQAEIAPVLRAEIPSRPFPGGAS